jgi:exodeoxyribonuclease V gamma subunit
MLVQYHGNDMNVLREQACALLARSPPPPLTPEYIVVPNSGMARWLRQGIAASLGIASNLRCDSPAGFIETIAAVVLDDVSGGLNPFTKESLTWRLMRLLPEQLEAQDFAVVRDYLGDGADQRRCLELCRRIASLFDQYLFFRAEWLRAWESGTSTEPAASAGHAWQALLWRALVADVAKRPGNAVHGAERLRRLALRLAGADETLRSRLPARVIVFGLTAMPPVVLQLLEALGQTTEVHLFHFNPCREFWGDIVDPRTRARWLQSAPEKARLADVGHSLLSAWGKLGRDALQLLLGGGETEIRDHFAAPAARGILGSIQGDILALEDPRHVRTLDPGDESLVFAEAHSPLREVEALHDQLLHLFESLPGLTPRDILVMAPDVGVYAPYIAAVFDELQGDGRYIPYSIADRGRVAESPVIQSVLHLLRLPESRFRASEVTGLLAVPSIGGRFDVDAAHVERLRAWIRDSGVRWGAGSAGAPQLAANTWDFGIERILLGVAMHDDALFQGVLPLEGPSGQEAESAGQLAEFVDALRHFARELDAPRPYSAWVAITNGLFDVFFSEDAETQAELGEIRAALGELGELIELNGFDGDISREVLLDLLETRLEQSESSHRFLRGAVSVSTLTPLRSIPFRVVCLLGMNAESYPRSQTAPGFDLMAAAPRLGDRSRRDDDRYLFLEALLSARDCFYLSYIGRDERSNTLREPAVLVSELYDHIDAYWQLPPPHGAAPSDWLRRRHRLKAFHPDYFRGAGGLFSYRGEWCLAGGPVAVQGAFGAALAGLAPEPVAWHAFERFFRNPCRGFFNQRLGVYFDEGEALAADVEPLELGGLDKYQLKSGLLAGALAGRDDQEIDARLLASGMLAHGRAGVRQLARLRADTAALAERLRELGGLEASNRAFDLRVGPERLIGVLGNLRGGGVLLWHDKSLEGRSLLRCWLHHLAGSAAGVLSAPSRLLDAKKTWLFDPMDPAAAAAELERMLAIFREGQRRALPLFPRSSHTYAAATAKGVDHRSALNRARHVFEGSMSSRGEGQDAYIARAFPDAEAALDDAFAECALTVFEPVLERLRSS